MTNMTPPIQRDVESARSVSQFVAALRKLADSLEQGRPHSLQVAGERVQVPLGAVLSIEHERGETEEELEFQMRWTVASSESEKPEVAA